MHGMPNNMSGMSGMPGMPGMGMPHMSHNIPVPHTGYYHGYQNPMMMGMSGGMAPGMTPGMAPGMVPGMTPGMGPGMTPGMGGGMNYDMYGYKNPFMMNPMNTGFNGMYPHPNNIPHNLDTEKNNELLGRKKVRSEKDQHRSKSKSSKKSESEQLRNDLLHQKTGGQKYRDKSESL